MASYLLRSEGVNFAATVFDTNDLSTIRGASLALLRLREPIERVLKSTASILRVELVFSGASQCAFHIESGRDEAALAAELLPAIDRALAAWPSDGFDRGRAKRDPVPPFPFLTIVSDIVAWNGDRESRVALDDALERATARNRARQFRSWTVDSIAFAPSAEDGGTRFLDPVRPRTVIVPLPAGKVLQLDEDSTATSDETKMSEALAAKRLYGRKARQGFYVDELSRFPDGAEAKTSLAARAARLLDDGKDRLSFADNFEDIIFDGGDDLPLSLANKIAVVYADGNAFSKIRAFTGVLDFAKALGPLRAGLLMGVLDWFVSGARPSPTGDRRKFAVDDNSKAGLRLETLLWGGDEFTFVVPAWLALTFTGELLRLTRGWKIGGKPLTHSFGVAIAHHKTPIRQLQAIAHKAADMAKEAGLRNDDSVTFEIFESLAPPDVGPYGEPALGAARLATYGAHDEKALSRLLAIPGSGYERFLASLQALTASDDFPRSQLYKALRRAGERGGTVLGNSAAAQRSLDKYDEGLGAKAIELLADNRLPSFDDGPGKPARPIGLELALLAQFWDYAPAFGGDRAVASMGAA